MCHIKTGENITQIQDLQNLVTASILRSKNPYTISHLSERIMDCCENSVLDISKNQVISMVRDTTIALLRAKYISVNAGHYYTYPFFAHSNNRIESLIIEE